MITISHKNNLVKLHFSYINIRLAWRESLRTTNWSKAFSFPSVSVQQIEQLLALVSIRKQEKGLEPEKGGYYKRKKAVFAASSPSWLRVVEAVRTWIMENGDEFVVLKLGVVQKRPVDATKDLYQS